MIIFLCVIIGIIIVAAIVLGVKKSNESKGTSYPYTISVRPITKKEDPEWKEYWAKAEEKNRVDDILYEKYLPLIEKSTLNKDIKQIEFDIMRAIKSLDLERDAVSLHFFILRVLEMIYKLREEHPQIIDLCLMICDIDINNADALFKEISRNIYMVTPTKKAVILEKRGDIDGAIAVCDWAIANTVIDNGGMSFEGRKQKLEAKKNKLEGKSVSTQPVYKFSQEELIPKYSHKEHLFTEAEEAFYQAMITALEKENLLTEKNIIIERLSNNTLIFGFYQRKTILGEETNLFYEIGRTKLRGRKLTISTSKNENIVLPSPQAAIDYIPIWIEHTKEIKKQ